MIRGLAWLLVPALLVAQQRDPGQSRAAASGTGEISGVVRSADSASGPVRRAVVTLTGSGPARSVITDDAGAFAFRSLPSESFFVTARKAAYLAAPYGATRPGRAGTAISLGAGEHATIALSMFKGAALSGVLRDVSGAPLPGVDVRVIDARTLVSPPDPTPAEIASTDDRGVYRLFGLLPGEYVVMALPSAPGGEIGSPSTIELDRILADLTSKNRGGMTTPAAAVPTAPAPRAVSFAPVFYPGTSSYLEAVRVKVVAGDERGGVDFQVRPLPVAFIEGRVSGDVANLATVQVTIIPSGPRFATSFSSANLAGHPIDAEGKFRYSNLPPGRYRIVARAARGEATSPASSPLGGLAIGRSGGGIAPTPGPSGAGAPVDYLYGFADVELRGEDVLGVSLVLQPGGTMSGRIVLNGTGAAAKPDDLTKGRTYLSYEGGGWSVSSDNLRMGPGIISGGAATIKPDGTFEVRGIGPGRFTFASNLPTGATGWSLRSATAGDRDLLDDIIEVGPGFDLRNVTITFSDAPSQLSGALLSASGQPTAAYDIVVIPADRALWRAQSRRILSTRPTTTGRFAFASIPAGRYIVAALTDLDPIDLWDPAFLEDIARGGLAVTVGEGERKIQDLRIK